MLRNRLRKNRKRLAKWARREGITCYRLYDADVPEYNVAIDVYGDAVHVQEYQRPRGVDPNRAEQHLQDVLLVVPEVLGVSPDDVFLKVRSRQRGGGQYGKIADEHHVRVVREGAYRFEVNLSDYLDTGLFLDMRQVRRKLAELSKGKRVLNLFAYTCSATVYAAASGARSSTSVDLSNTYLEWGRRNLELNGLGGPEHHLERADCLRWLKETSQRFDVALLAPPVFSRSKGMDGTLDLRRDVDELVRRTTELLAPGGKLLFTTHAPDVAPSPLPGLHLEEISRQTVPPDFQRSPHRAWLVSR
jgi:23S rRNA (guanine2445-N2)-methyltransferase / 23S rRNA (guanine2069-N7)-methyltransferase